MATKSPKQPKAPQPSIPSLVDELGQIDSQIEDIEALIPPDKRKTLEVLKKQRTAKATELITTAKPSADVPCIIEGGQYNATVSAAANETQVLCTNLQLQKQVDAAAGKGEYVKSCRPTLELLKKLLPAKVYDSLTKQERTGRRTIETAKKVSVSAG